MSILDKLKAIGTCVFTMVVAVAVLPFTLFLVVLEIITGKYGHDEEKR